MIEGKFASRSFKKSRTLVSFAGADLCQTGRQELIFEKLLFPVQGRAGQRGSETMTLSHGRWRPGREDESIKSYCGARALNAFAFVVPSHFPSTENASRTLPPIIGYRE